MTAGIERQTDRSDGPGHPPDPGRRAKEARRSSLRRVTLEVNSTCLTMFEYFAIKSTFYRIRIRRPDSGKFREGEPDRSRRSLGKPRGRLLFHFGVAGQVRLNAKIPGTPGAEAAHGFDEFFAGAGEGVGDLGRRRVRDLTTDDAVRFELTKLRGQDLFADAWKKLTKLGEALRLEPQMPNGEDLPFAADGVDGSLYRAAVMILQEASGLTKMCVRPCGYQIVIPFGQVKENPARGGILAMPA